MSYFIGVMSGTSLDGIDVALTSLDESGAFQFVSAQTFPFPKELVSNLQQLISSQQSTLQRLGEVNVALGKLIGHSINQFLSTQKLTAKDITAIGSHGQTLFHFPSSDQPFSMQIGDANVIAEITGITTIADFRSRDIAAGGQGAPLVPAFHQALFSSSTEDRIIVNIGGISNITLLPSSAKDAVIGFDTGPGNVLLDYWVQQQLKEPYDRAGQWAASGQCNEELLTLLLNEPYFTQEIPKSTGRELFNQQWLETTLAKYQKEINVADIQATLVELTAQSISTDISSYANSSSSVYVCGGGAHNDYLLSRLQALLPDKQITTTDSLGLHADWVEACAFAWLAYQTINQQAGNLPSVTGAKHPAVLGAIYTA